MPGQKAAVSIALTEDGASLLWESFKNPTSDISVLFALKFAGVTPAFQAKLKVNWDKVYTQHDIKLHAEGTIKVVKLQADVRAILESLRQQGAIQLDVVGENESMQKMLDAVYGHLITLMCDKVPMGPGEATSPPVKRSAPASAQVGVWPEMHPAWSMSAVADVVREVDARLRGGPFVDQEQAQTQQSTAQAAPCDPASQARAFTLMSQALGIVRQQDFLSAAQKYKEALAACPIASILYLIGMCYDKVLHFEEAKSWYGRYIEATEGQTSEERGTAAARIVVLNSAQPLLNRAREQSAAQDVAAADSYVDYFEATGWLTALYNAGMVLMITGENSNDMALYERAIGVFERYLQGFRAIDYLTMDSDQFNAASRASGFVREMREAIDSARAAAQQQPQQQAQAAAQTGQAHTEQAQVSTEEARRQRRQEAQQAQTGEAQAAGGAQQTTSTGTQTGGTKPPGTADAGTKPPTGQTQGTNIAGGQAQQGLSSGQSGKPPDSSGGTKPPTGAAAPSPAAKPAASAPEIKPIVSVQVGYSFKRVKMSGNYEVDMRKRLREDRDIVMSGNIDGIYQKYGEDKRFFSVVSLDDPAFQERSVEVILDGQDAADFKSYINAVSVLFRKQRFSGAPMTGEIKFVDQQFAQSGNRQSFKYGRLNEASTEWLDYEYKPKWSLYGGVEWEGEWTKTSDSVLTLTPPVRRRTIEISVDEDNILKNGVKALAIQVKHSLYGKEILKEVVINYDKGDPLLANYTYMHEDGNLGYGYKVVWLFLDGREIHTDWMAKESPFIYAVFTKK